MKNTNKGWSDAAPLVAVLMVLMLFIAGAMVGERIGRRDVTKEMQLDAIKNHAAHWEVDATTGASSFHWNNEIKQP